MIAHAALALLLAATAAGQLADVGGFAEILRDYDVFGAAAGAVAVAIPLTELSAAAALPHWPPDGRAARSRGGLLDGRP